VDSFGIDDVHLVGIQILEEMFRIQILSWNVSDGESESLDRLVVGWILIKKNIFYTKII